MSIELVMLSNHLILCCSLHLPSICPSVRVFSNESALHIRWLKYWSFSFSSSPSSDYSGLLSFRIDWFDLLAVQGTLFFFFSFYTSLYFQINCSYISLQGTLKSLFQHHNSKASILWRSAFFMVQLSHLYMITGKTMPLIIQTFGSKVMSLFSHMLSRFVIAFLPRSKCLLILWLHHHPQ